MFCVIWETVIWFSLCIFTAHDISYQMYLDLSLMMINFKHFKLIWKQNQDPRACGPQLLILPSIHEHNVIASLFELIFIYKYFGLSYPCDISAKNTVLAINFKLWMMNQVSILPTCSCKAQMRHGKEFGEISFTNKAVPNFNSTHNWKFCPTFTLHALRHLPVRSA